MGKADRWKHGDWNAICDRCGFKYKGSKLRKEWTGLRVCPDCWEPQQPQDFVRGRLDRQRVPWARPDGGNAFTTTTLSGAEAVGQTVISVVSATGAAQYGTIGIQTDKVLLAGTGITDDPAENDMYDTFWTTISGVSGTDITINDALTFACASGNEVYIMTNDEFLSVGDVTVAENFEVQ